MNPRSFGSDLRKGCLSSRFHKNVRRVGLLLALVFVLLAMLVHPAFVIPAVAVWVGLIVLGGGACPLCPLPDSSETPKQQS